MKYDFFPDEVGVTRCGKKKEKKISEVGGEYMQDIKNLRTL